MTKAMEFAGRHRRDSMEISGPDKYGDCCITMYDRGERHSIFVSVRTLAEMRAFLCGLLDGDEE